MISCRQMYISVSDLKSELGVNTVLVVYKTRFSEEEQRDTRTVFSYNHTMSNNLIRSENKQHLANDSIINFNS